MEEQILDSGTRREFESGAVRDIQTGKGRCDLLPLVEAGEILFNGHSNPLLLMWEGIQAKDPTYFLDAAMWFMDEEFPDRPTAMLELAKHFENGALKYGDRNWQKGIPAHCYVDSGIRHLLKYMRGDKDERHDRAFIWNMVCLVWTVRNKPECNDLWTKE